MLLKPGELVAVARELDEGLHGAIVQKVYHPFPEELWFELRQPGVSTLLCASARPGFERLAVADARPESPPQASGLQQRLRKLLGGKRLEAFTVQGQTVTLAFATAQLSLDLAAHAVKLLPAQPVAERPPALGGAPLTLARELGARVGTDDVAKKRLDQHLKKLKRTREKIAVEASRGPLADQQQRDGELLAQNLHSVTRGAKSVTLTEYGAEGAAERTVELDPKRSPKQQVEWLFHQAKRLRRGVEIARERLAKIDAEIAAAALPDGATAPLRPRSAQSEQGPSLPYREYLTAKNQRIWVGRGAKHNDALTFKVARPHHLWLHARGVPGAHVVVPLEKAQTIDQETLLDAAHLAFHHSDARGERQGEVSYTHVRYLKKGGAPGAVTYTRESTFWLRVEAERLERLLASARVRPETPRSR
ncbi:MAG: DUF814 domain-containing protein [Archangiaceae bacterium]|nr:DUF814 domain-containing protein [Archangiaceae bacterium]